MLAPLHPLATPPLPLFLFSLGEIFLHTKFEGGVSSPYRVSPSRWLFHPIGCYLISGAVDFCYIAGLPPPPLPVDTSFFRPDVRPLSHSSGNPHFAGVSGFVEPFLPFFYSPFRYSKNFILSFLLQSTARPTTSNRLTVLPGLVESFRRVSVPC